MLTSIYIFKRLAYGILLPSLYSWIIFYLIPKVSTLDLSIAPPYVTFNNFILR